MRPNVAQFRRSHACAGVQTWYNIYIYIYIYKLRIPTTHLQLNNGYIFARRWSIGPVSYIGLARRPQTIRRNDIAFCFFAGWLAGWLAGWFASLLAGWLAGLLSCWLSCLPSTCLQLIASSCSLARSHSTKKDGVGGRVCEFIIKLNDASGS